MLEGCPNSPKSASAGEVDKRNNVSKANMSKIFANVCGMMRSVLNLAGANLEPGNGVFPFWVGRQWDYNGYTNTPYKGTIACGYFVSTTLKHIGFKWNRYELAKMYSQQIVEDVCDTSYVFDNLLKLRRHLLFEDDNLFIIGLSSHVGLILKRGDQLYFMHSNYYDLKGPDKELLLESPAIKDSDVFWCGKFLTDSTIFTCVSM